MNSRQLTLFLALFFSIKATAAIEISSDHYHLHSDGDASETEEMSRLLEAAWPQFEKHFNKSPKLPRDKLALHFFNTKEAWEAKIRADDLEIPDSSAGGYYFHSNKTAYLFRQPTRYYTHCLLIHEAAHQFHYLARGIEEEIPTNWYMEGLVEHLSLHHWDGKTLTLGTLPVSLKDYAGTALRAMKTTPRPLVAMIENGQLNRALGAMVIRHMIMTQPQKFERFAKAIEKGETSEKSFRRYFGKLATFTPLFVSWLESHQEPLKGRFDEWERTGPTTLLGRADKVITLATFPESVTLVQCRVPDREERPGRVGLVLNYQAQEAFTVALLDQKGRLEILTRTTGGWKNVDRQKLPSPVGEDIKLAIKRTDDGVLLLVNEERLGPYTFPSGSLGLALDSCEIHFEDVSWK